MKSITVKSNGRDINGNKKYLYNFIDSNKTTPEQQKAINHEFGLFGRRTTKGISTQTSPRELKEWMSRFGTWLNMDVGINLKQAQKDIDKCNGKSGCGHCSGDDGQGNCSRTKRHAKLIEDLNYIREWLTLDIEEIC